MKIIGITGGIGSGKSTVCGILKKKGAKIIDADKISGEVIKKDSVINELVERFGNVILDCRGIVDKKRLADIVFNNKKKLNELNNIIHKYVVDRIINDVNAEKEPGRNKCIIIDAPIPVEHGFIDIADEIWVVTADKDTRIKRIMHRSGLQYNDVLKRINAQMSSKDYLKIADRVIYNNGNLKNLRQKVIETVKRAGMNNKIQ